MADISPAMEDYLETIYLLEKEGATRVTDIAKRMNVAKSSVHTALHTLADKGLILQERYGAVQLTEEGRSVSGAIYGRHKALIAFFDSVLGVSPAAAERDACAVEHILSRETMDKIIAYTYAHEKTLKHK